MRVLTCSITTLADFSADSFALAASMSSACCRSCSAFVSWFMTCEGGAAGRLGEDPPQMQGQTAKQYQA
jgi:hypothetical protein